MNDSYRQYGMLVITIVYISPCFHDTTFGLFSIVLRWSLGGGLFSLARDVGHDFPTNKILSLMRLWQIDDQVLVGRKLHPIDETCLHFKNQAVEGLENRRAIYSKKKTVG